MAEGVRVPQIGRGSRTRYYLVMMYCIDIAMILFLFDCCFGSKTRRDVR